MYLPPYAEFLGLGWPSEQFLRVAILKKNGLRNQKPYSTWGVGFEQPFISIQDKVLIQIILESTRYAGTFQFRERQGPQGSPIRHMEQLLLVTSCDSPAGIGASLRTDERTDGQTDVTLEIVFQIFLVETCIAP